MPVQHPENVAPVAGSILPIESEARASVLSGGGRRFLVVSPWGLGGGYSGPLTLMDRLFEAISRRGHRVDVVYKPRSSDVEPAWATRSVAIRATSRPGKLGQFVWGRRAESFLRSNAHDYDVIHFHGLYLSNQIAARAAVPSTTRRVGLPVLEGGDLGRPASDRSARAVKAMMVRHTASRLDGGLALSSQIRSDLIDLGLEPGSVAEIGNPASREAFAVGRFRKPLGVAPTLGFVGKVGGFKNPALVVEALAELRSRKVACRAVFVGPFADSTTETRLRALVRDRSLDGQVDFIGYTTDVAQHLDAMDAFVLPSSKEGLPGALCEAMAAGLPTVVTDAGSMAHHVISARCGTVVEPNASSIADGVMETLADWPDRSARAVAYATAMFSADAVATRYLDLLTSMEGTS